jgi:hypothetical protein
VNDVSTAPAHSAIKVLAALAELGEATAAAVAEHAGLGYSTTTPKLRAWEASGQAERVRTDDGRTLWRLTAAGRAATATPTGPTGDQHPAGNDPQPTSDGPQGTTRVSDPVEHVAADDPSDDQPSAPAETAPVLPAELPNLPPTAAADPIPPATVDNTTADDDTIVSVDPTATAPTGEGQDVAGPAVATPPGRGGPVSPAASGSATGHEPEPAQSGDAPRAPAGGAEAPPASTAASRRTGGSLRGAILDILQAHPDQQYKISELCKLIDAANTGADAKKASAGAVHNAAMKLVQTGAATLDVEKPATFALTHSPA